MYAATVEPTGLTPIDSEAKIEDAVAETVVQPIIKEPVCEPSPPSASRDLEISPLLPQSSLPGQMEMEPKRPKGRFPLVRQQSAPPGSLLPPRNRLSSISGASVPKPTRTNADGVTELPEFPDVQLRKKSIFGRRSRPNSGESTNSGSLDPDATAQAFRKALRTTSSNQYKRVLSNKWISSWQFNWSSLCFRLPYMLAGLSETQSQPDWRWRPVWHWNGDATATF